VKVVLVPAVNLGAGVNVTRSTGGRITGTLAEPEFIEAVALKADGPGAPLPGASRYPYLEMFRLCDFLR